MLGDCFSFNSSRLYFELQSPRNAVERDKRIWKKYCVALNVHRLQEEMRPKRSNFNWILKRDLYLRFFSNTLWLLARKICISICCMAERDQEVIFKGNCVPTSIWKRHCVAYVQLCIVGEIIMNPVPHITNCLPVQ